MCEYVDDGDQCDMDNHEGMFCHHHEDTQFAHIIDAAMSTVSISDDAITAAVEAELEKREEQFKEEFSPDWVPTTCDECDGPVRVICARIDDAAFQPESVIPMLALTCRCGDSVQYDPEWNNMPKSEIPDKWLFEGDR